MMTSHQLAMQQRNRLSSGGRIDRSKPLAFTFDGRRMQGYEGDTLASALLANGVDVIGRSFKYSRPRGIMTAGVEEPNAVLQIGATEATQTPNIKATEQSLYDGLVCKPVNGWPNVNFDAMGLVGKFGGVLMSPGFYYKTFMWPKSQWENYEKLIRKAAGLGRSPKLPDVDRYDHMNHHVDVLVVGAGPAGLGAALSAARQGARVMIADERSEFGGSLLFSNDSIDGQPAMLWVEKCVAELVQMKNVTVMSRATVTGYHDHNFLTISERRSEHLGDRAPENMTRQRLHKVRAGSVVLATGAHERPLVFGNNDLPGCMVASSLSHYINRFAVVPGNKLVVMTSNDSGYQCAFDWADAGRQVVAIVDTRREPDGTVTDTALQRGIKVITGSAVVEAKGRSRVTGALVMPINAGATFVTGDGQLLPCDTLASSGGWSPVVHLSCHTGSRPVWSEEILGFVPGATIEQCWSSGAMAGVQTLGDCLVDGMQAGSDAASAAGFVAMQEIAGIPPTASGNDVVCEAMPAFLIPHSKPCSRAPKQFVDMQNDVTAAGIEMSTREGFESIEHVKRYTAMGFGTDQGKTGNINGLAIVAKILGKTIPETGTTVFRPNYTPVSFGVVAGAHTDLLFDPQRFTPMHSWHLENGAEFENVGQWKRPLYFPVGDETMEEAIAREQLATRNGVGILDATTLGKIDIQGKDAREFLGRVYTNAWAKLEPGRCRYGLMCAEDGMITDDGVTSCLAENHFLMTTTTGGAAHVLSWLEVYHQTEWPEMEVFFNSVTDQWATMTIAGPDSRKLLAKLTDIDLSADAFRFMDWREAKVANIPARVFRISFTGDLSYEINVPSHYGLQVWKALFEAGKEFNLTPYGTETMHVLRAEKGFIIVGQDTDRSMTPYDMDHGWAVSNNKPFSFIGKRGMNRSDCLRTDRKQLVGLMTTDPQAVLPEGAQAVRDPQQAIPMTMVGHVTSSYHSAFLGRRIAMAVIKDGIQRKGEKVYFPMTDGSFIEAETCSTVFLDAEGSRQKA
ncbi:sarcosine oxidase subunit alpha family protein [Granulosicoccus antarcticus]|uniref:Sarcosine oxidase subunit alpha n=1 Tax=Granulosicoccus antarcticus IMCC3135 TaxID=1192854 RepID=A0A2Z2NRT2_9GAMM|nr:sarcosine oxidase subunit alpha family protein [Granulosicoccus antarcticus]ASJ72711.1 Sarcosine oxidase subunit alpha [Granulosicoccus antarcticus IMCC3135]